MRKYSSISTLGTNVPVPHSTIRGMKLAIQKSKLGSGTFKCVCPKGSIHIWEISSTSTHKCAGRQKKKIRVGKDQLKTNYAARLVEVKQF